MEQKKRHYTSKPYANRRRKPRTPEVDSTHGSSKIIPLNYKSDVLVQVWLDSRMLATLTNWLDEYSDSYPRFMSEVVRKPLEVLVEHEVSEGRIELVDDTKKARRMLEGRYRVNLNRGGRGKKNVFHNEALSSNRHDLTDGFNRKIIKDSDLPIKQAKTNMSQEEKDDIVKKYRDLEAEQVESVTTETGIDWDEEIRRGKEEGEKERLEEIERAKETMVIIPEEVKENSLIINRTTSSTDETSIREGMSDEELLRDREEKDRKRMELENAPINDNDFELVKE